MRALVIGGGGFYGGFVVRALERLDGVSVTVGGRRGPCVIDLNDPATFQTLEQFEVIIDAADTVNAAPDAAARYAVERGRIWVELSADRAVTERLLALDVSGPGALIVGAGIFPGLSTALAVKAAAGLDSPRIELGVRLSPFSGAGRGNCALMRRLLETPGARVIDGRQIDTPALFEARPLPFPHAGERAAAGVGLPDVPLIHRATGAAEVTCRMALVPGVLRFGFALSVALMRIAGPLRRPLGWLNYIGLVVLRAGLLRRVSSRVELVAIARDAQGAPRIEALDVLDGQRGTAAGVAALITCLRDRGAPAPGIHSAPEAFGAEALLSAYAAL